MAAYTSNTNNVLTVQTVQIAPVRTLMTALKDILLETNIMFTPDGIKIINMDRQDRVFRISVEGLADAEIVPAGDFEVAGGEIGDIGLVVITNPDLLKKVNSDIEFIIESTDGQLKASSESRFIGPIPIGGQR